MPDIVIHQLAKHFGSETALNGITFTAHEGEFLTLLGPSGCGKTTTLMSIAGFAQPDEGRISCGDRVFFDRDARVNVPAEDRNLGIVFQSYAIWPHKTVAENVAFPLRIRRQSRQSIKTQVQEVLELVEIAPYASRYPHELSGGQQQRVALARALIYRPEVLLLDEPFSNLDAKLRDRARTWLKELQSSLGLTTIFVTHDQDEALSMSDRIAVMDRGEILQADTPETLYRQPRNRFVAEFLGHCNILSGHVVASTTDHAHAISIDRNGTTLILGERHLTVGDDVEVAVRPESIVLSDAAPNGAENSFAAVLRSMSFLGDHYVYELEIGASSDAVRLTATNTRRIDGPAFTVTIPKAACQVLAT
jgi:iron(III) transport system ATP-binding protein